MEQIYLDNNATTFLDPDVVEAIANCSRELCGNPASQHQSGRRARRILEDARERIASILGANTTGTRPDQLIFTSGGTESNNLAIRGLAGEPPGTIVISSIEHPSVASLADELAARGYTVARLQTDDQGLVRVAALDELLNDETRLVSVMLANNETGVVQPVHELVKICQKAGVPFHTDAVQAVAKVPVNFQRLQCTSLSFSAHKFHGPVGIGGLLLRHNATLKPVVYGGFQQQGIRPGTESVALAVGMGTALEIWHREATRRELHMTQIRSEFESRLRSGCSSLVIHGASSPRLPNTTCAAFPGVDRQAFVMALDLAGVACSTGSACASGSSEPSPVLQAMGIEPALVESSVRLSVSSHTTGEEVARAADCILKLYNDLQRPSATRKTPVSPRKF